MWRCSSSVTESHIKVMESISGARVSDESLRKIPGSSWECCCVGGCDLRPPRQQDDHQGSVWAAMSAAWLADWWEGRHTEEAVLLISDDISSTHRLVIGRFKEKGLKSQRQPSSSSPAADRGLLSKAVTFRWTSGAAGSTEIRQFFIID